VVAALSLMVGDVGITTGMSCVIAGYLKHMKNTHFLNLLSYSLNPENYITIGLLI
jgi:hypothetical protein